MHRILTILAVVGAAAAPRAQDPAPPEVVDIAKAKAHFAATGDLVDIRWGFDPEKGLLICPNPTLGGNELNRLTPQYQDDSIGRTVTGFLQNSGSMGFFALALFGDQDLASHAFVDYHFRRMRLDRTPAGLRRRIAGAGPEPGENAGLLGIHRLMAVRIVQRRRIAAAVPELRALTGEPGVDLLLRWAAEEALATLTGEPIQKERRATRFPSVDETLAAVPNDFDAILTIDYTRMPFHREISWFGRRVAMETSLRAIERAGGTISPSQLAGAQMLADVPSCTAFRLAQHVGNLRISRLTVTVGAPRGAKQVSSWVRVDGMFDAARLLSLLGKNGWKIQGELADPQDESGSILRVTRRFLEVRSEDYATRKSGDRAAALKAAGFGGDHVIFAQTGKLRRLGTLLTLPLTAYDDGLLVGKVTAGRKVDLKIRFPKRAPVTGLMNLIGLGMKEMRGDMATQTKRSRIDPKAIEALFFPRFEQDDQEPELRISWDGRGLTFEKALAALGMRTGPSRQDGPER